MSDTDETAALDAAQADMDAAWSTAEAARLPLVARARQVFAELEGVTGLPPGPGANKLIDVLLELVTSEHKAITTVALATADARAAQQRRDEILAGLEPAPRPVGDAMLEIMSDVEIREWLRNAGDTDVRSALADVLDTDTKRAAAEKMLEWVRIDGNLAGVIDALNEVLVESVPTEIEDEAPASGVGPTSTYAPEAKGDDK